MSKDLDFERVCRNARAALTRLKKSKDWQDWMVVGVALQEGRTRAMKWAGTNRPEGKAYNGYFSEIILEAGLQEVDKAARAHLLIVMSHLAEIETFRASLPFAERSKLNHPSVMVRKWRAATAEHKPKPPKPDDGPGFEAHIAELEAARESMPLAGARETFKAYLRGLNSVPDIEAEIQRLRNEVLREYFDARPGVEMVI
jgi:hypothetical protein